MLKIATPAPLGAAGGWELVREVALGLDLTRRGVQTELKAKGLPWTTAKSFAGAAVLTDFVPLAAFADKDAIDFTLTVNGEPRQQGNTRDMLFKVPRILAFLLQAHALRAGDLVYTGTPKGVGPLTKGDAFVLAFPALAKAFNGTL